MGSQQQAGFHGCFLCSRLGQYFRNEKEKIQYFCEETGYGCRFEKGRIVIETPIDTWMIAENPLGEKIRIYHENHGRGNPPKSPYKGYHHQGWRFVSIYDTLLSIYDHRQVYFSRPNLPGRVKAKLYKSMGTHCPFGASKKKKAKRARKTKARAKRYAIKQVLDLIDGLAEEAPL